MLWYIAFVVISLQSGHKSRSKSNATGAAINNTAVARPYAPGNGFPLLSFITSPISKAAPMATQRRRRRCGGGAVAAAAAAAAPETVVAAAARWRCVGDGGAVQWQYLCVMTSRPTGS